MNSKDAAENSKVLRPQVKDPSLKEEQTDRLGGGQVGYF